MSTRAETLRPGAFRPTPAVVPISAPIIAPVGGWRRMFGDWLVVGSATAVCQVLGLAAGLLFRLLLGPAQMGIWQALKLFLSYGNYASLGISKGAVREFNVALGSGESTEARHGLNLAFTVNTLSSLTYAAVLLGVAAWIAAGSGSDWASGWALGLAAVAVLAVVTRYVTFHVTILRAKQAFAVTSRLSILEALLTLSVAGLATWRWGLPGLYGGTLLATFGSVVFVRRYREATLRWAWNSAEIRRLIGIGGPILLAGVTFSLFRTLDKLMILAYLSDREFQLGCYSLALMVTTQLFGLGNMLSIVLGPRYAEQYGRSGDRRVVARLAARSSELVAAVMALPAALALLAAPPLLRYVLPDYQAGLAPLVWLVPGAIALALALPASQYLVAVDRQRIALAAVLIATVVAALGNHVVLCGGYGLIGVAAATTAGHMMYFVLVVATSIWIELDRRGRLRYLAMLALALGPTMGCTLLLRYFWPTPQIHWPALAAQLATVLVVWGWTIAVGWRWGDWATQLKPDPGRSRP